MPYVPKPDKGYSDRSFSRIVTGVQEGWDRNGGDYSSQTISSGLLPYAVSSVIGRSSNKPIRLSSGTIWKPVSGYRCGFSTTSRHSGSIVAHHWDTQKMVYRYTGPPMAPNLRVVPPHFEATGQYPTEMSFNTRNRLNVEVMQKVASRRTNYGADLGEMRSTLSHLAMTAKDLLKAYKAVKKGDLKTLASMFGGGKRGQHGSLESRWLEYQFGWLPLMGSIYDSHQLLTKGFRQKTPLMSATRRLTDHVDYSYSVPTIEKIRARAQRADWIKLFYSIENGQLSMLAQMGLINPFEVAWELTPFSFVVDWFLPVGNFLEACTARLGVTFIDGYYGTYVTGSTECIPEDPALYNASVTYKDQKVVNDFSGYRREKLSGFPIPALYLKNPLSTTHVLDALALIRQLTK